ncbi:Frigida-like protein [Dioscorea alata]|uniref:Frigida-like protein n=3 Tax=Dioscorea alata TaxID=55571 RepID=A0ACB7TWP6_DIOAL|nr:Frigida-like protein [Dioscorea alata]KAH7652448.1 Frigida-like protein [Dioscorea alata]KAH7652449.1 Frigida-like protein [Dioscorea alata]
MAESEEAIACIDSMNETVLKFLSALDELDSRKNPSLQSKIPVESSKECVQKLQKFFEKEFRQLEEKENSFEEMKSEIQEVLAEREATIADRERTLLDRLQEMKDISVSALAEAHKKRKMAPPMKSGSELGPPRGSHKSDKVPEANDNEVMTLHELKQFCKKMDVEGVLRYVTCKRKHFNLCSYYEELSIAIKCAHQPARLVLNILERLLFPSIPSGSIAKGKDISPIIKFKACLVLMESLVFRHGRKKNYEIKNQAKAIARKWKATLGCVDLNSKFVNKLQAQGLVQLIVTYGITAEFDENELCKLVLAIPNARRASVLCQSLGIAHRVPEVVEALVNSGKQIPAIHFIFAFNLGKSYPPIYLLEDYLNSVRSKAHLKVQTDGAAGVKVANNEELAALRNVIWCAREYKLQREYNLDPLQARIMQLEDAKAKKRKVAADAAKNSVKKARVDDDKSHAHKRPANDQKPSLFMLQSRKYPLKISC